MFEILGHVFMTFEIISNFIKEIGINEESISKVLDTLTKQEK